MAHVRHLRRGDHATVGAISLSVHAGTHVDAPSHHFVNGYGVDELPLEILVGPAVVVDASGACQLSATVLSRLGIPAGTERVLVRTRNSDLWRKQPAEFTRDYVGLTEDGAHWVVEQGIRLFGTDYLSVVAWDHLLVGHRILLGATTVLLEGVDLGSVAPGEYRLVCLPLRIAGGDGAPARAVLIEE
jgi:arylformamidase